MGINLRGITGKPASSLREKTANSGVSKAHGSATSGATADSVNLTDAASLIQKAEQALAAVPAVNIEHVENITRQLANGQYEIDDEQIAGKIIEMEKSLYK